MGEDHQFYRRRISRQQLEVLVQYMERYPALALASARSREGHIQSKRMWEKIARTLNRVDQNQARSGNTWARYWIDLKFKIRRKYTVIQKCQSQGTHCTVLLSSLEERVVKILTDDKGNLIPTGSIYHQMLHYPLKPNTNSKLKSISDPGPNVDDSGDLNDNIDDTQDDYLITNVSNRLPEHILIPEPSDIKPNVNSLKNVDIDPIQILSDEKKSIEELKRELVEFELRRQKELFEIEKQQKIEKHEMEMSILRLKKQLMVKELNKL